MKKGILLIVISLALCFGASAQTANELLGKWKLIKWTKNGKQKDITAEFKTDQVYQVFSEKNTFISVVGDQERKSKWKLSKDNKILTIRSGLIVVPFRIDYFDSKKRTMTADQLGTMEYQKVD